MTAIHAVLAANLNAVSINVVVAAPGGGVCGYAQLAYGSVSPATFRSVTINNLVTISTTLGFRVGMAAVVPSGFFSKILVENTSGGLTTLLSSAATFTTGGSTSQWDWTVANGTALQWTTSHASKNVVFYS